MEVRDEQTQIVWDFLETAFRTGTLDRILDLAGVITGKEFEDMSQAFADLEDVFMEMADTSSMEEKFGQTYAAVQALTDDEILEGLGIVIGVITPVLNLIMQQTQTGSLVTSETQEAVKEKIGKAFKALSAVASVALRTYLSSPDGRSAKDYGRLVGQGLNALTGLGNEGFAGRSGGASDFMAGVFEAADGRAIRQMTDTLADGFLDQRPPLLRWTAATAVKRARKRILG